MTDAYIAQPIASSIHTVPLYFIRKTRLIVYPIFLPSFALLWKVVALLLYALSSPGAGNFSFVLQKIQHKELLCIELSLF